MFEYRLKKNLRVNETVVLIVRKYPIVFFWQIVISAVFIIAPFFFLYPLMRLRVTGVILLIIVFGAGIALILRIVMVYSFNTFLITDERIIDIDQHGFFDRTVSETTYEKIQDVSFRIRGVIQTLLHYGSVIIQTAGSQANIELDGVKNPEIVQQSIIEIQREKIHEMTTSLHTPDVSREILHPITDDEKNDGQSLEGK